MSRWFNRAVVAAAAFAGSPVVAPQLLAFPHLTTIRQHRVYSEAPIGPALARIVAAADARVARSPLGSARPLDQDIFLTTGGWRWQWLALGNRSALAISRPIVEVILVNRSDQRSNLVDTGAPIGGRRTLDGVLAHEMTHGAIRAHFGTLADRRYPTELREGYCDYVSGGGTLTDAQAKALIASGSNSPALRYWRGRNKVEAGLAANGGNVDALFASWGG